MVKFRYYIAAALLFAAYSGNSQDVQKIGYADWNYIFSAMPEFKQVDTDLKVHGELLQQQIMAKTQELEKKATEFRALPALTPEAILADKQREIQLLDQGLQQFQQDAQKSYEAKRTQLMDPVFSKVGRAIEGVAIEHGYAFILNPTLMGGGDILLYTDAKFDVSDLVLKKMGVAPPPKPTPNK